MQLQHKKKMSKMIYLFTVMDFFSFEILPLASLPHVANKVLLPDHKVENASKGSWSCNKNGLLL